MSHARIEIGSTPQRRRITGAPRREPACGRWHDHPLDGEDDEILRQITQKTNPIGEGGAVDVPTVITMGHGLGVEFTHKTVGDVFHALTTEWDAFEFQQGSGTKEGANKRLVAADEAIPDALWEVYEAETGEEANEENAVAESSDDANEVR